MGRDFLSRNFSFFNLLFWVHKWKNVVNFIYAMKSESDKNCKIVKYLDRNLLHITLFALWMSWLAPLVITLHVVNCVCYLWLLFSFIFNIIKEKDFI